MNDDYDDYEQRQYEEPREQENHEHEEAEHFKQELRQSTTSDKKTLIKLGFFVLGLLIFFGIVLTLFIKVGDFRSSLVSQKEEADKSMQSDAQSSEAFGDMMSGVLSKNTTSEDEDTNAQEEEKKDDLGSLIDDNNKLEVPALTSSDSSEPIEPVKKKEAPKPSQAHLNSIEPGLSVGANGKAAEESHLKAFRSELDPSTTLAKSTLIRCVLMQDVASTMESQTRCQVAQNVYSSDGSRILIPAGSIASGASLSGFIKGQQKMFIVWDRLITTHNIIVPLKGSQSVDKLGELGHKADVKSNFFIRFGNALMVSILSSAIEAGFNDLNSHDQKVDINTSGVQSNFQMGLETLKNELDVQPIARIKRGTMLNIMVSEDVNFSEALDQ